MKIPTSTPWMMTRLHISNQILRFKKLSDSAEVGRAPTLLQAEAAERLGKDWLDMYLFIPSRNTFLNVYNLYYINSFMYLLYLFVYINVSLIKFIIPPHSYSHVPRRGCICPHPPPEAGESSTYGPPKMWTICCFWGNKWTCSELLFFFQLFIL